MAARFVLITVGLCLAISSLASSLNLNGKIDVQQMLAKARAVQALKSKALLPAKNHSKYIVGGEEATPHEYPWAAALFVGGSFYCSASLISDRYVLTAAHCVDGVTSGYVYLGAHNIEKEEDSRIKVNGKSFTTHPGWNPNDLHNDLGLIELETPVEFNENIQPVNLPSYSDVDTDLTDETVTIIGWGRVGTYDELPGYLKKVDNPVVSNKECNDLYGIITDEHICTGSEGPQGICFGDSGSSVNWRRPDGKLVQVGINSFIAYDCESEYPNGETRVTSYLDFLAENTNAVIEN